MSGTAKHDASDRAFYRELIAIIRIVPAPKRKAFVAMLVSLARGIAECAAIDQAEEAGG